MRWSLGVTLTLLLSLSCTRSGTRTTDTRSSQIQSKELKLAFLRDYLSGPTAPLDAEFHLVFHDNSQGMIPGSDDMDLQAVIKVKPDDVSKWAAGCTRYRLEAWPPWAEPPLRGKKGFEVSSPPDTFKCGAEERVIHVHEGVIFRRLVAN